VAVRKACFVQCLAVAMLSGAAGAEPAALRDPTEPPLAYSAKPGGARIPSDSFRPEHLVSADGKRFVVWKSRRYGVGDSIQGSRIERIEESEVWLRSDGNLRKLSVYGGIEKNPARADASKSSAPPGALKGNPQ
jgi:hypothetical protein